MQFDPVIPVTCSLILSYVFVVASLHKWQNIEEFRTTLTNYQIVPDNLLNVFIFTIPAVELLSGIALLIPVSSRLAALSAAVLLLMYMFAIGINLIKGRRSIDCGCGGTEQKQAISEWLLLRNGVLLFLAYCITASVQAREFIWFDWIVVFLATIIGCLFYNIINQLLVNKDLLKGLRSHHG
jgi:uncharacterized membrane protein